MYEIREMKASQMEITEALEYLKEKMKEKLKLKTRLQEMLLAKEDMNEGMYFMLRTMEKSCSKDLNAICILIEVIENGDK